MLRNFFADLRWGAVRLYRIGQTQSQAVAFNLFLTFFPAQLLVLGILSTADWLRAAADELLVRLRLVLPPGSREMVVNYLLGREQEPAALIALGLAGTLLIGQQVMLGLMQGFRLVYNDAARPPFWQRQWRALVLVVLAVGPWMTALVLAVAGQQIREWLVRQFGLEWLFGGAWWALYVTVSLALPAAVLAVVYRIGRPETRAWREVLPGALVATVVWWAVNLGFGFYVRRVPYSLVYGALAAAIGLLIWMYVSVLVVFFGAAFNAARGQRLAGGNRL